MPASAIWWQPVTPADSSDPGSRKSGHRVVGHHDAGREWAGNLANDSLQCALRQIPVIILTAVDDRTLKAEALNLGATDFLTKPVDPIDLVPRMRNALAFKTHQDHLREVADQLERQVQLRTVELAASRLEVIHCLGRAAEYRDNDTGMHVVRVGRFAGIIARQFGLDPAMVEMIEHAAPLHDVGKIGIPDAILLKRGQLTRG